MVNQEAQQTQHSNGELPALPGEEHAHPDAIDAEIVDESFDADARDRAKLVNVVAEWLREQSPKTAESYAEAIGFPVSLRTGAPRDTSKVRNGVTWLRWCDDEGIDPFTANRNDVLAWIRDLHDASSRTGGRVLSKGTKAHMLRVVSSFYRWATEEGHIPLSPVQVNRKKQGLSTGQDESNTRSLDRTEVADLQDAADNDRITAQRLRSSAIVATLFGVGLRVSELTGITTEDMAVMQGVRVLWLRLKGNRQHVVELPEPAASRIDKYFASRSDLEHLPALTGQTGTPKPLFVTATGRPVQPSEVNRLLKRLAKQAELDQPDTVHAHVARHTWITIAREEGIESSAIQQHVGHRNSSTTARYGKHALTVKAGLASRVAAAYQHRKEEES